MAPKQTSDINLAPSGSDTPYKLDPDQTLKASKALLTHMKLESQKLAKDTNKKSLLAGDNTDDEEDVDAVKPVWLNLATKRHIVDKNKLKPSKIRVPHALHASEDLSICLITADPQRLVKNAVADESFPTALSSKITRIIGLSKLVTRYKSFESRRQLVAEHDVFLADDRIVLRLPKALGKAFYKGTAKRPIPISIAPRVVVEDKNAKKGAQRKQDKEAAVASPSVVAAEIQRALACIPVSLKPGLNVAVRVGLESFTADQLSANISAVVPALIEKHVVKGWRNVRSINIKSPTSFAIPIWQTDDLWTGEDNLLDADEVVSETSTPILEEETKRKRNPNTVSGPQTGQRKKAKTVTEKADGERRKLRLAAQKAKSFESDA